jgi:iron(III) transport system substrate-binding protein
MKRRSPRPALLVAIAVSSLGTSSCGGPEPVAGGEPAGTASSSGPVPLTVLTDIHDRSLDSVLAAYRAETGAAYRVLSVESAAAADEPAADVVMGGSFAGLWAMAEAGVFRPLPDEVRAVTGALRDPEARWTAVGTRLRLVVYDARRVAVGELGSVRDYAALGQEAWRGRLCLSSSAVPGNRLLLAYLLRRYHRREAEIIVRLWRANLAEPELASDDDLLDAMVDGRCDIGIADSAALAGRGAQTTIAAHFFTARDALVPDLTGVGIARHARRADAAAAFIAWLLAGPPNGLLASGKREFPVDATVAAHASVRAWRPQAAASASLEELGFLLEEAARLAERARYR